MKAKQSSATLFVRCIPEHFTERDLRSFATMELRAAGVPLDLLGHRIGRCKLLRIIDPSTGEREHHGLIEIHPTKLAHQAIAILDGKAIDGRHIGLHRYHERATNTENCASAKLSRATGPERRRANLAVEEVGPTIEPGLLTIWRQRILASTSAILPKPVRAEGQDARRSSTSVTR